LQEIGMVSLYGRLENIRGDDFVSLRSLVPTLSYRIDENELTLDLTVTPEGFGDYVVGGRGSRPEKLEYREDTYRLSQLLGQREQFQIPRYVY
jgi:hypothetical protein